MVLGVGAAHALSLGGWTLVPWGLVGLAVGYSPMPRRALIAGAVYGFVLCLAFVVAGYHGAAPLLTRIPFFLVFGVIGAVFGAVLGWLGSLVRRGHDRSKRRRGGAG